MNARSNSSTILNLKNEISLQSNNLAQTEIPRVSGPRVLGPIPLRSESWSLLLLSHELFELILLDVLWYFSGLIFNTQCSLFLSALFINHLLDFTLSDREAFLSIQELKWHGHSDVVLSFSSLWY